MGKIVEFPAATPLHRSVARLNDGMTALHRQRDDLVRQTASLAGVRAALEAQVVRTDEIADLAAAIEAALACDDRAALQRLQARLQDLMTPPSADAPRHLEAGD